MMASDLHPIPGGKPKVTVRFGRNLAPRKTADTMEEDTCILRVLPQYAPAGGFGVGIGDPGAGSISATTRPKFGGRWGGKHVQASAGLSAAEQTMRDTLITKGAAEEQRQQQQRQQNQPHHHLHHYQRRRHQNQHAEGPRGERHRRFEPAPDGTGMSRWQKQGEDPLQPDRQLETNVVELPRHLRRVDWICPDCQYNCFGKHCVCPRCKAARPDLHAPPPRRVPKSDNTIAVRHLDLHRAEKGGKGEDTYYARKPTKSFAEGLSKIEKDQWHRQEPKSKSKKKKKADEKLADLSWDPSSLEHITAPTAVQRGKASKHKDSRKQRQYEVEEDEFDEDEERRRREDRKQKKREKSRRKDVESAPSPLYLPEFISVSNLADVIGVRPALFVRRMEEMGFEDVSYSHVLDAETAGLVATEFNFEPIFDTGTDDLAAAPEPEDKSLLPTRPPVVTIMGHVDHGKTTILDWLRKSSVAASEHGGITQHIGAFSVAMPSGKKITFLDTPGHAAFLEMRRRGADVTDIVVLVVAADDSVKPQTLEAIKHATESKVPIIVAISKVDKENVNLERVKQDLSVHGVHVEDYGGDVQAIGVSGKTGQGMLELEEAIVTLSEVLDHRADADGNVEGWVIEATTKSYGRVATALIRRGTLRPGDIIVAGNTWARVRTLRNEAGTAIPEATPGMPVEIDGWREQPSAGSEILQTVDEQHAKEVVEYRQDKLETHKLGQDTVAINEARRELLERRRQEGSQGEQQGQESRQDASGPQPVHFIIKADVGGSAEAVLNSVTAIGNNEVYAHVLRSGVGPVGEFDIEHAATANGHVISFNMPIDPAMFRMAEARGVRIMDYNIIYKLIDEVKATLSDKLAPSVSHRVTGEAEISQIFEITLKGREKTSIAGCRVRNGVINRARKVRVLRGQETIYDGSISSLKNVKKDVTEMRKDTECGIGFNDWKGFAVGDHIQCYEEVFEKRYL
ncbi:translation initiation factor 2 [Aspergillus tanneri]|uniref:Translation initiation factor IF-2, mitochondrial n=1 Tax=Aspergillus tanneri TaxID=1220188 RepID=A0A5M9MHB1_9EURO|nr:uncharacterized protein ATNIH1004_008968 [Aspergillus tanneri]KAA8644760.1 hypothetical protein ATNIH1004_008968 [Aspergillus tanneri]